MKFFIRTKPTMRWWKGLLVLIFATAFSNVQAQPLSKKLTVSFSGEDLLTALQKVEKITELDFAFNASNIDHYKAPVATYTDKPLEQVLKGLLRQTALTFKDVNGYIIINKEVRSPAQKDPGSSTAPKDPGSIAGKVIAEESGLPLMGASIRIGNRSVSSDVNGYFKFRLPAGDYTAIVSHIGYGTKEITDITVKENQEFALTVSLKRQKNELAGVTVRGSAKKESAAALYTRQKNSAAISDGISAEQIRVTPDNNTAQVLKRISGLTVQDEKFVTVRGLSERYNNVTLNGASLPSTEPNRRNFAFDIIPSSMVDNIVVNKTATPDLPAEFAGGLIQVNTRNVPNENYTNITIGTGINTNSTGKPFYGLKRGQYEAFGFAGKERTWWTDGNFDAKAYRAYAGAGNREKMAEMSRTIPNTFGMRDYGYQPVQNMQIAMGRRFDLKNNQVMAFSLAASTRHEENIVNERRHYPAYYYYSDSLSRAYNYNSALGGLASLAWQSKVHKLVFKSLYNRRLSSSTTDSYGASWATRPSAHNFMNNVLLVNALWHNRLEGEHLLGKTKIKLDWSGDLIQLQKDQPDNRVSSKYELAETDSYYILTDANGFLSEGLTVFNATFNEKKKSANVNITIPFTLLGREHKIKTGYAFNRRDAFTETMGFRLYWNGNSPQYESGAMYKATYGLPDYKLAQPEFMQPGLLHYKITSINGINATDDYSGIQRIHAGYVMADLKLLEKLRLVGGVRLEENYMRLTGTTYQVATGNPVDSILTYNTVNWLPSANLTYNLSSKMNIRLAYSKTLARADFRERSTYRYYDANEKTIINGAFGLKDGTIDNADLRWEFYPGAGEVMSLSLFYKKFKDPVELVTIDNSGGSLTNFYFNLAGSENKGIEWDFRKSLGFIYHDWNWLSRIFISGNASWMKSEVEFDAAAQLGLGSNKRERPLLGLSPYTYNGGLGYFGDRAGLNINYNRYGRRIIVAGGFPYQDQYENPRDVLDLQISARFLKNKLEVRFNISDLLQQPVIIYQNISVDPPVANGNFIGRTADNAYDPNINKDPKGLNYNKDLDYVRYRGFKGRNTSLNLTYNF